MAGTRGERLRTARVRRGFKSARLAAKALGVAISTYGAHERAEAPGGRGFGPEEAKFYGRRFGVSPEWLLTGRPQSERDQFPEVGTAPLAQDDTPKAPIIGYVGLGGVLHRYAVAPGDLDLVKRPRKMSEAAVAAELRTDVVGPYFRRWLIVYENVQAAPSPELVGELCVVGLHDGRTVVKQVHRGSSAGLFNLVAQHLPTMADAKIEWATRIDYLLQPHALSEEAA
jgi:hypothetical protein